MAFPGGQGRRRTTEAKGRVTLAAWQIAVAAVAVGIGLMWLSSYLQEPSGASPLETTIKEVGALLVVTGALTVLWDLRGRRALTDEVLAAASLSSDVSAAGLRRVSFGYLKVNWDALFDSSSHVDLFFAYARTWRNSHATALRRLLARDGTRVRVILPDRTDEHLMNRLSHKFGYTPQELSDHIADAESDFENLGRQAADGAVVEMRKTCEFPVFTYYRFDRVSVGVLYAQARGRTDVPTFECEQGGTLDQFFRSQFETLWEASKSIRPEHQNEPA